MSTALLPAPPATNSRPPAPEAQPVSHPNGSPEGLGVVEIPLTHGYVALIDAADFACLRQYKWYLHPGGYACRKKPREGAKQPGEYMHRSIMQPGPGQDVDHIDHNRLNNTRVNLRVCTRSQNQSNKIKITSKRTSSQYKGVCHTEGRWLAHITLNQKFINLGRFDTEIQAALAYDRKAPEVFGAFALLNFPNE